MNALRGQRIAERRTELLGLLAELRTTANTTRRLSAKGVDPSDVLPQLRRVLDDHVQKFEGIMEIDEHQPGVVNRHGAQPAVEKEA